MCATPSPTFSTAPLENVAEVTLRKQEQCANQPKKKSREGITRTRHADPSDGFLAVRLEPKP